MIWIFYNVLFVIGFTLLLPRFFWRMWKRGGYRRNFMQRLAHYDASTRRILEQQNGPRIWVHAVSVGEMYVALRFMDALRKARPELCFALSTTTSTGHALARARIREPDVLIYFPVDIPPVMSRVLKRLRPVLLMLVDTELWPNLVRMCRRRDIPVTLVNGRVSPRSFRRYQWVRMFTSRLLPEFNVMCMQSEQDRERLIALGAPADKVFVPGSAKYEIVEKSAIGPQSACNALRGAGVPDDALVLLGGSTWPGEEEILLDLYQQLRRGFPALKLVLVPRHVERSETVINTVKEHGLTVMRRSAVQQDTPPSDPADVLLVDTTGELQQFYSCATLIFVGKSLTVHGGQNIIEPAVCGKPIVVGPNMENFPGIMEDFLEADALIQVQDAEGLRDAFRELLADADKRNAIGERAARLVEAKSGAIQKALEHILPLLDAP